MCVQSCMVLCECVCLPLSVCDLRRSPTTITADSGRGKFSTNIDDVTGQDLPHLFPSNGDMRLVTSSDDTAVTVVTSGVAGRLEVYIHSMYCSPCLPHQLLLREGEGEETDGRWGTVCGLGFSLTEAHVVCRQLGYQGALKWDYSINTE